MKSPFLIPQQARQNLPAQVSQDFSLRRLAYLLPEYAPPPLAGFIPTGKWRQDYTMFLLQPTVARKVGSFSLQRSPRAAQSFMLTVRTRRIGNSGYSQFQHAEMQCTADTLASPVSWLFETKMALKAADPPYLMSGRRRSANVTNGTLTIHDKLRATRTEIHTPYSSEWTLLEAVQRLPGPSMKPVAYTLIDEYDTPQPNHKLAYRAQIHVNLQSGPEPLTGYCDLGRAVVPTVYWIDKHGRLLFVCTGLMIYALNATNGQPGRCPHRYPAYEKQA